MNIKRTNKIFITVALTSIVSIITYRTIRYQIIAKRGIYIAAVIEKVSPTKSGSLVEVKYYYKHEEFKSNFKPGFDFKRDIGRKFYIKILPGHPSSFNYYDIDVPECALDSNWRNGWKEIPQCDQK